MNAADHTREVYGDNGISGKTAPDEKATSRAEALRMIATAHMLYVAVRYSKAPQDWGYVPITKAIAKDILAEREAKRARPEGAGRSFPQVEMVHWIGSPTLYIGVSCIAAIDYP